jgi:hypothetical protein
MTKIISAGILLIAVSTMLVLLTYGGLCTDCTFSNDVYAFMGGGLIGGISLIVYGNNANKGLRDEVDDVKDRLLDDLDDVKDKLIKDISDEVKKAVKKYKK